MSYTLYLVQLYFCFLFFYAYLFRTFGTVFRAAAAALLVASGCPAGHSPSHVALDPVWRQAEEAGIPVVFHVGGTGDLTWRKLMPALFQAFRHGKLPAGGRILAVARDEQTDAQYHAWLKKRFQEVEGLSGTSKNDVLRADDVTSADLVTVNAFWRDYAERDPAKPLGTERSRPTARAPSVETGPPWKSTSEST